MTTRSFTQYLLSLDEEEHGGIASIMSAMSVLVRQMSATLARFPLDEEEQRSTPLPLSDTRKSVHALLEEELLEETQSMRRLAGISIAEQEGIHKVSDSGRYLLLVDMLHGMANVRDNLTVGTAFSILEREDTSRPVTEEDFLQPGRNQLAAGVGLFGPRTILIVTTGEGVEGFTHDRELGSFVRTRPGMRVPAGNPVFSIDSTQARRWPGPVKRYVDECVQGEDGPRAEEFTMRWNASSLVGAYRVLNSGGLFLVPDTGREDAILPLMHNAAPLAFLAEQAGGASSTGREAVLDIQPKSLRERVGYYLGSKSEVDRIDRYYDEYDRGVDREPTYALFKNRSLFAD